MGGAVEMQSFPVSERPTKRVSGDASEAVLTETASEAKENSGNFAMLVQLSRPEKEQTLSEDANGLTAEDALTFVYFSIS